MRYYFLRLLSLYKSLLGYLMSTIATLYNKTSTCIKTGVEKEKTRVLTVRDTKINNAKVAAEAAAYRVIEVASDEEDKAQAKLFKLQTKVK